MNILLLGGTGAIGSHLVSIITSKGRRVSITSRSVRDAQESVDNIYGNALDLEFLDRVLAQHWDVIVDFMSYTTRQFDMRIKKLLDATNHYIFLSSARVYADSRSPINETDDLLLSVSKDSKFVNSDEYAISKARQENMLKLSMSRNWTIVRPYITFSENRMQLGNLEKEDWLYRALNGRRIIFCEDLLDKKTTLSSGQDVATVIWDLICNPESKGEVFNISEDKVVTWGDVLSVYREVLKDELGSPPEVVLQNRSEYLSWNTNYYPVIYDRYFDRVFDNSKRRNISEHKFTIDVRQALRICLKKTIENPKFNKINWRKEALKDYFSNETTSFREIPTTREKIIYLVFRRFPFVRFFL